uniref:SFRICE_021595 n=1 Tax=Spodoptera frugiperda TaxID=7108 RepID=A0A2H1VWH4_SPOFR
MQLSPRHSLRELFKEIDILTVPSQYIYENVVYAHKNINLFKKYCDIHNINTRIPTTRLKKISGSFRCQCIRFYKKIPRDIQSLSLNKFKNVIKEKLYSKAFYKIKDYLDDSQAWE